MLIVSGESCWDGKLLPPQPSTPPPWGGCPAQEPSLQEGASSSTSCPQCPDEGELSPQYQTTGWVAKAPTHIPIHRLAEGRDGVPARLFSCITPARFTKAHLPKPSVPEVHCIKMITEISSLKQLYFNSCKPTLCVSKAL